jgi:hypothetical protein
VRWPLSLYCISGKLRSDRQHFASLQLQPLSSLMLNLLVAVWSGNIPVCCAVLAVVVYSIPNGAVPPHLTPLDRYCLLIMLPTVVAPTDRYVVGPHEQQRDESKSLIHSSIWRQVRTNLRQQMKTDYRYGHWRRLS